MKFGIFYEHQLPRPWERESEYRLLQDSLAQIELEDRLGFEYAWEVGHHVLEDTVYAHRHEDIVRLTPEALKGKMAAKEAPAAGPAAGSR
jgi:hypothetical protein